MPSCVSFFRRFARVARGMPSAERKASNVCAPKKASRIIRNAHESETMSSVRATEQFRSRRSTAGIRNTLIALMAAALSVNYAGAQTFAISDDVVKIGVLTDMSGQFSHES